MPEFRMDVRFVLYRTTMCSFFYIKCGHVVREKNAIFQHPDLLYFISKATTF